MNISDVSLIGLGGLGGTLARTLAARGIPLKSIYNRSPSTAATMAEELDIAIFGSFPSAFDELGELVLLTVADAAIGPVARHLSALGDDFTGKVIAHCSGNLSSAILDELAAKKAYTAAFHPLQTFTKTSRPEDFEGIYFNVEGDKEAVKILGNVAKMMGAHCFEVPGSAKPYLHAAAVMASNYLFALLDASTEIGRLGNLEAGALRRALLPLMQTTLQNAQEQPLSEVLSGPIIRGDLQTVEDHLQLLAAEPDLQALYKALGMRTLHIAEQGDALDASTVASLRSLLEG